MSNHQKNKRKHDDVDDGFEDGRPGGQALPVALRLPDDGVPSDGAEYLLAVRLAAAELPNVTKVANPFSQSETTKEDSLQSNALLPEHPELPSDSWRDAFTHRFNQFRQNVKIVEVDDARREEVVKWHLPGPKDRPAWRHVLFGRAKRELIPSSPSVNDLLQEQPISEEATEDAFIVEDEYVETQLALDLNDASTSDEEDNSRLDPNVEHGGKASNPKGSSVTDFDQRHIDAPSAQRSSLAVEGNDVPPEPTLELLRRLPQGTLTQLLIFYDHWLLESLDGHSSNPPDVLPISPSPRVALSSHHAKWLFMLLAHYDNVIATSRDISSLRSIARSCVRLISRSLRHGTTSAIPAEDRASIDSIPGTEGQSKDALLEGVNIFPLDDERESGRSACWMIVAAITFVWGQLDLWDDANKILLNNDTCE